MMAPARSERTTAPDSAPASTPPMANAEKNRPRFSGFPPKRSALIIGNKAIGMAVTVEKTSDRKAPVRARCFAMNCQPAHIERSPGRSEESGGASRGNCQAPIGTAPNVTMSSR